jgi:hypothetical protein
MAAVWRGLRRSDIFPLRPGTLISGLAGRHDHLITGRAPRRLAARHLQLQRLEQAPVPLHLVAFDLLTGTEVRLSDGRLADAVLAARRIYVLPTQNPDDRGLPRPPAGALAAAVHSVNVLTNARLQARYTPRWPPSQRASRRGGAAHGPSPGAPRKRPELEDLRLAGPRLISRGPDRDLDHVLMHVDPRDVLMQYLHACHLPSGNPRPDTDKHAARQSPGQKQDTDTRSRRGSGGYPARGSGANLSYGHERSISGRPRRAARTMRMHLPARPRHPDAGKTPARRQPPARPRREGPSFHPPRQSPEGAHENLS